MSQAGFVEDFFRHEYGRLVASLSCRFGVEHIEDIEDAAQTALLLALENWKENAPANLTAWLFRVARNHLTGEFRKDSNRRRLLRQQLVVPDVASRQLDPARVEEDELDDDLLRMLFYCCDDAIPVDSQIVFALKTLCGFAVHEIAVRLFTTEPNVYKRLARARKSLRELGPSLRDLTKGDFCQRLPSVHKVLYLIFTEGHLSANGELAIRRELTQEAIRLTNLLSANSIGQCPETFALLALMFLNAARLESREDSLCGLVLLEEQDRTLWDRELICHGLRWLARSATGSHFSRYHAEAGIAAEHCLAPSFNETRWDKIVECYRILEEQHSSPIHQLNRAVALAEWHGPETGLEVLQSGTPPSWLKGSYLWSAVLSDLNRRSGHKDEAVRHRDSALRAAPSETIRKTLARRLRVD